MMLRVRALRFYIIGNELLFLGHANSSSPVAYVNECRGYLEKQLAQRREASLTLERLFANLGNLSLVCTSGKKFLRQDTLLYWGCT